MIGSNTPRWGTWQMIYFTQGPEAAAAYCEEKREALEDTHNLYDDIAITESDRPEVCAAAERLRDLCDAKQDRYAPDIYLGTKMVMRGRGQPGRTPFNYPDFAHRFTKFEDLHQFIVTKISRHAECVNLLKKLIVACPEEAEYLEKEKVQHEQKAGKWFARANEAQQNPEKYLLPQATQKPFEIMKIDALFQRGFFGEGAVGAVVESGIVDYNHPALQNVFANLDEIKGRDTAEIKVKVPEHPTRVIGVIAAQPQPPHPLIGAAHLAKIHVGCWSQVEELKVEIVNLSSRFRSGLCERLHDEKYLQSSLGDLNPGLADIVRPILEFSDASERKQSFANLLLELQMLQRDLVSKVALDRLLISALGNDGVDMSLNPALLNEETAFVDGIDCKPLCIHVVSLQQNGLYPDQHSTLPGKLFAESSISAIGNEILTTDVGGGYVVDSGGSYAAPWVTSVALALKGAFPELTREQIRGCILQGANPLILDDNFEPVCVENSEDLQQYTQKQREDSKAVYGWGRLNADGAVNLAQLALTS